MIRAEQVQIARRAERVGRRLRGAIRVTPPPVGFGLVFREQRSEVFLVPAGPREVVPERAEQFGKRLVVVGAEVSGPVGGQDDLPGPRVVGIDRDDVEGFQLHPKHGGLQCVVLKKRTMPGHERLDDEGRVLAVLPQGVRDRGDVPDPGVAGVEAQRLNRGSLDLAEEGVQRASAHRNETGSAVPSGRSRSGDISPENRAHRRRIRMAQTSTGFCVDVVE